MTFFYLNSVESTVFHKVKAFVSKYSWIKPNMLNGSMKAVMFKELWLIVDDEEVVYIKDASDMPVLKTVHEHVSSINSFDVFHAEKGRSADICFVAVKQNPKRRKSLMTHHLKRQSEKINISLLHC